MENTRFHPMQHKGYSINCDQVSDLLQVFDRYLPKDNTPAICRKREMLKYAMFYEIVEILRFSFEDDAARWNATPNEVRHYHPDPDPELM